MPTGYTATLNRGEQTFPEFAMECARAFGALVTLRDSPTAEVPDRFEPSDYHKDALAEAEEALRKALRMDAAKAARLARKEHDEAIIRWEEHEAERKAIKARYEAMLIEVEQWKPPTPDHEELRKFMIDQLTQSIDFDCKTFDTLRPKPMLTPDEFKQKAIDKARRDVAYHAQEYGKEVERANERTDWVRALRASLESERTRDHA